MGSTGPYTSQSVAASASGVTLGSLGFSISDGDLALSGYHYTVWGRYGSRQYATLSSAVAAESSFDNTDNGSAVTDRRIQGFYVVYTADSQSAVVQVATNSPINAGQTMGSAAGVTSGSLSFAANTENSLYSPGYHYTVTGPDGSTYSTLSSAVAANSLFDNTTNTGSIDGSVQSFMVSYTADSQIAVLAVDSDSPIDSGSVIDSVLGKTAEEIPFRGTDSLVKKPGYSYVVYYETNGDRSEPYATLSAAQADHTMFDNTSNDGTSDADMQSFIISYVALKQQATIVGDVNSPIYAGYQGPTTSEVTNGSMALPLSDGDLYEQGY